MRTLRVLLLIVVVAMSYMLMTGISSCRGSVGVYENLLIFEVQNDYFLDWEGEGWDWGQMGASITESGHEVQVAGNPISVSLLTWHIGNPNVLMINSSGYVYGQSPGTTTVYATYSTGTKNLTSNTVTFQVEDMPQQLTVLSVEIQEEYQLDNFHEMDSIGYDHNMEYNEYLCFRAIATYSDFSTADVTQNVNTDWKLDPTAECLEQDSGSPWCVGYPGYLPSGTLQQAANVCEDEITVEYTYNGKMVSDTDSIGVWEGSPGE